MAITTLNNRAINRADTAASGESWTATSATASDFQAGGGTNTPAFLAYRSSSAFSLPNEVYTKVVFNAEKYDTDSGFNITTGEFTAPEAGKYLLGAMLYIGAGNPNRFVLRMQVNGASIIFSDAEATSAPVANLTSTIRLLSASDVVKVDGYQDSGSAQNLDFSSTATYNYFFGMKIIE